MNDIFHDSSQLFVTVLSLLNPIGMVPIFLAMTAGYSNERLKSISRSCAIAVIIGLITSAFMGKIILDLFSISLFAFQIGGGILISMNALSMIKGSLSPHKLNKKEIEKQKDTENIGIVPLAIPLLVGPGTISAVILHTETIKEMSQWSGAIVVFLLMGLLVYLVQISAKNIKKILGTVGVNVMTRIMGLILIAVGAQFIITGIKGSFHL